MNDIRLFVEQLSLAVDGNEPIDASDEELLTLARLAVQELCSRLPLGAVRRGDLPASYEDAARTRASLRATLADAQIFASTTHHNG